MVTLGALPKVPLTVTAAADEEELEEPPHPASTPTASSGRAVRTAIRRMGNKPCRRQLCRHRRKPRQPSGLSGPDGPGPVPGPSRPATTAAPTLPPPAGYLRPPLYLHVVSSHAGDKLLHPLVGAPERVLAQHGPLRLVVQLEMHPVHGEIAPPLLRAADELAPQPGPGGLRGYRLRLEDVDVPGGTDHRAT